MRPGAAALWLRGIVALFLAFAVAGWNPPAASAAPPVPVPAGGTVAAQSGHRSAFVQAIVTVTGARANGHLVVHTCGTARPATSSLNYTPMSNTMATVAVRSDASGFICIYSLAAAHIVVDFIGIDSSSPTPAPARLLDTRLASQATAGRLLPAGHAVEINTGVANATMIGTLTSTGPVANGYLVLYTCGAPLPAVSSANFAVGETRATLTVGRTDARGRLCLFTSAPTHAIYDRIAATTSISTTPPQRRMDTRPFGWPAAGAVVRIPVSAPAGWTVWGTLVTTGALANGHTVIYNCAGPLPPTSATQVVMGKTLSQLVAVRADGSGAICVYVSSAAHVVFDEVAIGLSTGTPNVRVLDTRTLSVPRHPGTGKDFYPTVQRWADKAAGALAYQGLPVEYLPGVLAQVQQESSGIPDIANNWDSNWQRGMASFGLLQTIYPTFNFHAPAECKGPDVGKVVNGKRQQFHPNMVDPDCNLRSALAYVKSRYGTSLLDRWNQGINRAY